MENIFSDLFYTKFCLEMSNLLKGWKPTILPTGEYFKKLTRDWLVSLLCYKRLCVFVQVTFILVWRRSICGTVSSWERFHPACCSTRCSISSPSSSTTRQWSSTVASLLATSSAALEARAAPKWPVCVSIPPKMTRALVSGQSYHHRLIVCFVFLLWISFVFCSM